MKCKYSKCNAGCKQYALSFIQLALAVIEREYRSIKLRIMLTSFLMICFMPSYLYLICMKCENTRKYEEFLRLDFSRFYATNSPVGSKYLLSNNVIEHI